MTQTGFELIELTAGINYSPTFISTDKRLPANEKTTIGYNQIGEIAQYGFAHGPVFKIEFVNLSSIATATHVKIWGLGNQDAAAPLYPITYFNPSYGNTKLAIWLKKFEFCDNSGDPIEETNYTVVGYKKKAMPLAW